MLLIAIILGWIADTWTGLVSWMSQPVSNGMLIVSVVYMLVKSYEVGLRREMVERKARDDLTRIGVQLQRLDHQIRELHGRLDQRR